MTQPGRSSRGQVTRKLILDTAETAFLTYGYAGTHVEGVAGTAHVSVGTVYLHFQSKEGLYAAVIDRAQEVLFRDYLDPVFEVERAPWETIRAWCHAYVRFVVEQESRARITSAMEWSQAARPPEIDERLRERVRSRVEQLLAVFRAAAEDGALQGVDPVMAHRFVWGSMFGISALNLRHGDISLTPDEMAELVENGLRMLSGGRVPSHSP
ncbi:MAG: TetR/AcrR family transcriptional regulator [Solirubrobacteraceae bacterium]|nr:TetR/AcrR family transcriptional regulator [Solirubrobacteraceae bacterium]